MYINLLKNISLFITSQQTNLIKNHLFLLVQKDLEEEHLLYNFKKSIQISFNYVSVTHRERLEKLKQMENIIILLQKKNLLTKSPRITFGFGLNKMDFTLDYIKVN